MKGYATEGTLRERYPGITKYMETTKEFARKNGYVTTMYGRRRYLNEIEVPFLGGYKCLPGGHNPELFAVITYEPDLCGPDTLVYPNVSCYTSPPQPDIFF